MQRLFNITKWKQAGDGTAINFGGTRPRRVRLDVNAPEPVNLFYNDPDGLVTFLARVVGRDVIEFQSYGEFAITIVGGDLWFHTEDGEDHSFAIPDAVILTQVIERRPRNRELEMMNYMMNQNLERRLNAQRAELEQLWAKREAAARAVATQPQPASDDAGSGKKSEPKPVSGDAGGDKPADDAGPSGKAAKG